MKRIVSLFLLIGCALVGFLSFSKSEPKTASAPGVVKKVVAKPQAAPEMSEREKKSIAAQIREAEYWVTQHDQGMVAPNRAQQMGVRFDESGFTLTPWKEEWSFRMETEAGVTPTAENEQIRYERSPNFTEWFENSPKGIEHGMTLTEPIGDQKTPLVFTFPVETELTGYAGNDNQILFKDAAGQTQLRYEQLFAFDAEGEIIPTALAWNSAESEVSWTIEHQEFQYPLTIDPLITRGAGKLVVKDGGVTDGLGTSMAMSGDLLAVGSSAGIGGNVGQGAVYVFERVEGFWEDAVKLTAQDGGIFHRFGSSLSFSGDVLAVGAATARFGNNVSQGSVYLYERRDGAGNAWDPLVRLVADGGKAGDQFGRSVSLCDDTLAVGAEGVDVDGADNAGLVYLYERDRSEELEKQWKEVKKLTSGEVEEGDAFGWSVSLSEGVLAVGARFKSVEGNANQGKVYIFERDSDWENPVRIVADNGEAEALFGTAVSVFEGRVTIGAPMAGDGAVYIYERRHSGGWSEVVELTATDGAAGDNFGASLVLRDATLAVGASLADVAGKEDQGAVYLYERDTGGENLWNEVSKLVASDSEAGDRFGESVALSGDALAVGAVNARVGDNNRQGAAYLFDRPSTAWMEVTSTEAEFEDEVAPGDFGQAIAATSTTLVIGAPSSTQEGEAIGRAYVFEASDESGEYWKLFDILAPDSLTEGSRFGASVAVSGQCLAVGTPGYNNDTGRVYFFSRGSNGWSEVNFFGGEESGDFFGASLAMSTDCWLAVGAPGAGVSGEVLMYERNAPSLANWGLKDVLVYASPFSADAPEVARFGSSVAMDGMRLLVGAPGATGQKNEPAVLGGGSSPQLRAGFAFLHHRNQGGANAWGQVARLGVTSSFLAATTYGVAGGQLGEEVSLSGDWAVVSQPGEKTNHVFHREQEQIAGAISTWGESQSFADTSHAVIREGTLALTKRNEATVEIYQRDSEEMHAWERVSVIRPHQVSVSFGETLAMSGAGTLFIGTPGAGGGGQVRMWMRGQLQFHEVARPLAEDGAANDKLGHAVALSGEFLAVGAPAANILGKENQGAVYLFARNQGGSNAWGQIKKLTSSGGKEGDSFGSALSFYEDVLAVGAPKAAIGTTQDLGAVYLFGRDQGQDDAWGQVARIIPELAIGGGDFGAAVSLDGNTLAVGAPEERIGEVDGQGAVYLFGREEGENEKWLRLNKLTEGSESGAFGFSVSLSGEWCAVGAPDADSQNGEVHLIARNFPTKDAWGLFPVPLKASDESNDAQFGYSLSLSNHTLAVGAPAATINGNLGQGAVYLFENNQRSVNDWGETAKLTARDGGVLDLFGRDVSLSGNLLAVGSLDTIPGQFGVGAVYLYERHSGGIRSWSELEKLTSGSGSDDWFGQAVALSGQTLAVGAELTDNGDVANQGTAFVFEISRYVLEDWKRVFFDQSILDNLDLEETTWGDFADPDGDGLTNLEEAYYNLNPKLADRLPGTVTSDSQSLTYQWQRSFSRFGVQTTVLWSPDLQTWYRSGEGPAGDIRVIGLRNRGSLSSNESETLEALLPRNGKRQGFLRLEFTR